MTGGITRGTAAGTGGPTSIAESHTCPERPSGTPRGISAVSQPRLVTLAS
jgi:hypothetical protein